MTRDDLLPGFDDRTLPDRYGDLVLTGGVTSAIAYPGVVFGLAQVYRFNAIGGASSGSGLAAMAAAAEFRRRGGSTQGFDRLLQRTADLSELEADGRTRLAWLFQPAAETRRLFRALLPAFCAPTNRLWQLLAGGTVAYADVIACAAVVAFISAQSLRSWSLPSVGVGWQACAPIVLCAVLGFIVLAGILLLVALWCDLQRAIAADFGLCSGQARQTGAPQPPLTAWLHDVFQDIAGLPVQRPLTFRDLHDAPGGPRDTLRDRSAGAARSIDLRMVSANLSAGRPQMWPQADDEPTLYFRPVEMRRLFPPEVVDFMKVTSTRYDGPMTPCWPAWPPRRDADVLELPDGEGDFWALPREDLPVVVAVRMSVAFPVLFSAVPLWGLDGTGQKLRRQLFVDGGLCSNFPIHLFDSPLPAWPTFGIALQDDEREVTCHTVFDPSWVRVPQNDRERLPDRRRGIDQETSAFDQAVRYAGAALATMKDWNDKLQAELPGVRERVAQVTLPLGIGGLNLLMEPWKIRWLARSGVEAARQLLERYAQPADAGGDAAGWREHRWIRFNVLVQCLQSTVGGVTQASESARYALSLREQIRTAVARPPLAGEPTLTPAQAASLEGLLEGLLALEQAFRPGTVPQPYQPSPKPELRVRPSL